MADITADEGLALSLLATVQGRLEGMAIGLRWPDHREPDPAYLDSMANDIGKARRLLYPFIHQTLRASDEAAAIKEWTRKHGR